MKHQRKLLLFILFAIALTSLGYLIDKDLPYQKWSQTAIEFSIISFIIFTIQSSVYGFIILFQRQLKHK